MADSIAELSGRQGSSASQVGFGAAQALTPGIISLFSRRRRKDLEDRAEQLDETNREKRYGFGLANINRAEGELLRNQERAPGGVRAKFAGIGASGGSQEAEALRDQDHQFNTRMGILNQQRAELKWGRQYGDEVRSLQDSMRDLDDSFAKINALIQTGLFVASAAVGGGVGVPGVDPESQGGLGSGQMYQGAP